jgi:hypothetical protein
MAHFYSLIRCNSRYKTLYLFSLKIPVETIGKKTSHSDRKMKAKGSLAEPSATSNGTVHDPDIDDIGNDWGNHRAVEEPAIRVNLKNVPVPVSSRVPPRAITPPSPVTLRTPGTFEIAS